MFEVCYFQITFACSFYSVRENEPFRCKCLMKIIERFFMSKWICQFDPEVSSCCFVVLIASQTSTRMFLNDIPISSFPFLVALMNFFLILFFLYAYGIDYLLT